MIYADNAATTPIVESARVAMQKYLEGFFWNVAEPYSPSYALYKEIEEARQTIATCISAEKDEIYFTSGGSESDNWVIKLPLLLLDKKKVEGPLPTIITTNIEHHAILNSASFMEKQGFKVIYLKADSKGVIKEEQLEEVLKGLEGRREGFNGIVSIMIVNNEIGTTQDIKALCQLSHKYNYLFHSDAVQAIGHIPFNVKDIELDFASFSSHKAGGPKGAGFLFVKKTAPILPLIHGGGQERGLRGGTTNTLGIAGMAAALREYCLNIKENTTKLKKLEEELLTTLEKNKVEYIRNGTNWAPGNVSLSFNSIRKAGKKTRTINSTLLLHRLDIMGIYVAKGSACNSGETKPSYVLEAIGLPLNYANATIRVSFGVQNKTGDGVKIAEALTKILVDKE